MPYEGEFAQYKSIQRIATSERVQNLRGRCEIRRPDSEAQFQRVSSLFSSVTKSSWLPKYVVAIDGSKQEVPVENGFPGAEIAYLTVASVMLDIGLMRDLDAARPVDPKRFRSIEKSDCIDTAFPGCNVVVRGDTSAKVSLRRLVWEELTARRMSEQGERLLDTYEALLQYKGGSRDMACPYEDCRAPTKKYTESSQAYTCPCDLARPLFSTDALRFHEGMNPTAGNGAMFAEIMQVLERLWILHVLRTMEERGWLTSLRRLAFVLDGPLAVFGHPAWLSDAIFRELRRINDVARRINKQDILLIGIEKTGLFASHFETLDRWPDGSEGRVAPETLILLTDEYIKSNIIFSESERPYGEQTYFGRKCFYKTRTGALITASLPYLTESHKDLRTATPEQFPRISDALAVIDSLVSSRFPNSLVPLIAAHAEAAIPMNLGQRVLEQLARELVNV